MGRRIVKSLDKMLNAVIIAICVILAFTSAYSLIDNFLIYEGAQDETLQEYKPPEEAVALADVDLTLDKQVGWLQIYDTNIDYPLMQGEDNYEFLNLDPYGEFKLSGSIFLDSRNSGDFSDPYSVIYGHHMEHGNMFGSLDYFMNEDFFNEHRWGRIVTQNAAYDLELFAVASGDGTDQTIFNPQGRTTEEITEFLEQNSMIYTQYTPGDKIVSLTTCWGDTVTSRLLIFGVIRAR